MSVIRLGSTWLTSGRRSRESIVNNMSFTWVTTSPTETLALPTKSGYSYNVSVDWGDGNSDTFTTWNQTESSHEYATADTYTVTITGDSTFQALDFDRATTTRTGLREWLSWGDIEWTYLALAFNTCPNATFPATDSPDLTNVTDLNSMFNNCTLANPITTNWITTAVTTFANMFASCPAANPDVSLWDVSSATSFNSMFTATTLANPDVSSWTTTALLTCANMFQLAAAAQPDFRDWNVASLTSANLFLDQSLSATNATWSAALVNFNAQSLQNTVAFDAEASTYSGAGAIAARAAIIADHSWTIGDGGVV